MSKNTIQVLQPDKNYYLIREMDPAVKKRNREIFALARERIVKSRKGALDLIYTTHNESAGADRSFFFFTGITAGSFLYSSAVVSKDGSAHLFVPELEEAEVKQTGLPYTIIEPGKETLLKAIRGHKYIGVNANGITLHESGRFKDRRFSLVNIAPDLEEAVAVKARHEIDNIRKACEIAAVVAANIPKMVEPGMSEKELAAKIDFEATARGSDRPAFDTIVAFGENSAIPHAAPSARRLKKGDLILCDFGATFGKMCSDITRVFVSGTASAEQTALYKAILAIQEKALLALKAGVNGRNIHQSADAAVAEFFRKAGAPGKMGHSLGHSIGLYAHDGKRIGPVDYTIPENFVTTVEPAGYLSGFGGVRIEDTVLVTRRNSEILTEKAPKACLVEIK